MNSRTAGRWIAAPLTFVGVRWATRYMRHAAPDLRAVVELVGGLMLGVLAIPIIGALFVTAFPRLGARLFPWLAGAQHKPRRAP